MVFDMKARLFRLLSFPPDFKPVGTARYRHFGTVTFLGGTEGVAIELPCHISVFDQQPDMVDMIGDAARRHELALGRGHLAAGHVLNDLNSESGRVNNVETQVA